MSSSIRKAAAQPPRGSSDYQGQRAAFETQQRRLSLDGALLMAPKRPLGSAGPADSEPGMSVVRGLVGRRPIKGLLQKASRPLLRVVSG